ncbi:MAG: hypothetical protein ACI4Q4_04895, partial [Oscillospiraceae bacterium]
LMAVCLVGYISIFAVELFTNTTLLSPKHTLFFIYASIVVLAAGVVTLWVLKEGETYSYKASTEEFRVYDRKGREIACFYYCDVKSVSYHEMKYLFFFTRGYHVTIVTKYRTVEYKWIFPRNIKWCPPQKTPFNIIAERIPPENKISI